MNDKVIPNDLYIFDYNSEKRKKKKTNKKMVYNINATLNKDIKMPIFFFFKSKLSTQMQVKKK